MPDTTPPTPAVYFDSPAEAYEALVTLRDERAVYDAVRNGLVLGALSVFPAHGGVSLAARAIGMTRPTIDRIRTAGRLVPVVTERHHPDLLSYAETLAVRADRSDSEARGTADKQIRERLYLTETSLRSLAKRIEDCPPDDIEIHALVAHLRMEAKHLRSGTVDLYEGRVRHDPRSIELGSLSADLYDEVADQLNQMRLHGDAALDALDGALLDEARQRMRAANEQHMVQLFAGERYVTAVRTGTTVHGDEDADQAAVTLLTLADQKRALERQAAELASEALELVDQEAGLDALRRAAAADAGVRQALEHLLGQDAAAAFLTQNGDRS
ncbi:hypothetical protein ABZW18_00320 [Streptomyces sp. NPDC004647]|uniref:hypothetical protein n=1 Tax=Streptomyces sp. NPDC004647 TaxID=3154671 RepID=UPI0033A5C01E